MIEVDCLDEIFGTIPKHDPFLETNPAYAMSTNTQLINPAKVVCARTFKGILYESKVDDEHHKDAVFIELNFGGELSIVTLYTDTLLSVLKNVDDSPTKLVFEQSLGTSPNVPIETYITPTNDSKPYIQHDYTVFAVEDLNKETNGKIDTTCQN